MTTTGSVKSQGDINSRDIITGLKIDNLTVFNIGDELARLAGQPEARYRLTPAGGLEITVGDRSPLSLPPEMLEALKLLPQAGDLSALERSRLYAARLMTDRLKGSAACDRYIPLAGYLSHDDEALRPSFSERRVVGEGPKRQAKRLRLADVTEAVDKHPAFVLLGPPGSGKTTVLQRLAFTTALAFLNGNGQRLPLLITLADYRRERELPLEFIRRRWVEQKAPGDFVDLALAGGLLLLADGLNEMPHLDNSDDRRERANGWERFIKEYFAASSASRAIVASRDQGDYDQPLGLPRIEIDALDDDAMRRFAQAYLPADQIESFLAALDRLKLRDQARIPFPLYILTQLYDPIGGDLPPNRGQLFARYARRLIEGERKVPGWYELEPTLAALAELGYATLQQRGENAGLPAAELEALLPAAVRLPGQRQPASTPPPAVFDLACRAGLLARDSTASGEEYKFSHQLLQEQFAGQFMLTRWQTGADLAALWFTPRTPAEIPPPTGGEWEPLGEPPATRWQQATILAAGITDQPDIFVWAVLAVNPALAGRCLTEGGLQVADETRAAVQQALLADLGNSDLHRRARIQAGRVLGVVGDLRFQPVKIDVGTSGRMPVEVILPDLILVPGGAAKIGSRRWPFDRQAFKDERPQRQVVDINPFYLARYPVTNAEYACFIQVGGYDTERYWTPTGWQWRQGKLTENGPVEDIMARRRYLAQNPGVFKQRDGRPQEVQAWQQLLAMSEEQARETVSGWYPAQAHTRPSFWNDPAYSAANQPVVGVTWYEVMAYCAWLREQLAISGQQLVIQGGTVAPSDLLQSGDWQVRLPTEAEWEWAAGGAKHTTYPWGSQFDEDKANTLEGRVLGTAPVGAYPDGAAACGALDMSGNVWEWMYTLYKPYPYHQDDGREDPLAEGHRTLRGGSWLSYRRLARVFSRFYRQPDFFNGTIGFRLVVAPCLKPF